MNQPVNVRVGDPADVHDMMALATSAAEENGMIEPSTQRMLEDIWAALNREQGIIGIIGPRGAPEAAILMRIVTPWYSDKPLIEERGIFVHPDYRSAKGGRAARLVEFGKQIADRLKLPLLIGVLSNSRTAGKMRLYKRFFGEEAGIFFLYGAKTGSHASARH